MTFSQNQQCFLFNNHHELLTQKILEQLEKIESGMDSINADMQIAEKALKGMELCCGIFPKFWKKYVIFFQLPYEKSSLEMDVAYFSAYIQFCQKKEKTYKLCQMPKCNSNIEK